MIDKEVAELRRRFHKDRNNISRVKGCYVNTKGEIITTIDETLDLLPLDEQSKYLDLLKKSLSGKIGKNLVDIEFSTKQVMEGDEHKLLMRLRKSELSDEVALNSLFAKIAGTLELEVNYLILLAYDCYDVPYKSSDGMYQSDAGDTQHSYIVCSICPVKETNAVLHYDAAQCAFHDRGVDWVVFPPELGFMFPAFDDRATNIYNALYYTRSASASFDATVNALFKVSKLPMAVNAQRDTFREVLSESLGDDCSVDIIKSVHTDIHAMVQEHKEAKIREPLRINGKQVGQMLGSVGISEEKVKAFGKKYDEAFGDDAAVPPQNLLNDKLLEYRTADVIIKVNPDRQDLVHARKIGGVKYLLVNVSEGVEVNGINASFKQLEDEAGLIHN